MVNLLETEDMAMIHHVGASGCVEVDRLGPLARSARRLLDAGLVEHDPMVSAEYCVEARTTGDWLRLTDEGRELLGHS